MEAPSTGFVPPPYPHDRLTALRRLADAMPGGVVDCSVGTPVDPLPDVARRALVDAVDAATGYPPSIGTPAFREAAASWIGRRFGVEVRADGVIACVGTKELVTSLPHVLHLRNPVRDTVFYPAIAYPSYEMGARLAGLRPVPVPLDTDWYPDLERIAPDRRRPGPRALAQRPRQPHRIIDGCRTRRIRRGVGARTRHRRRRRRVLRRVHVRSRREAGRTDDGAPFRVSTACSPCTHSRSVRTWPACAPGSSPGILTW